MKPVEIMMRVILIILLFRKTNCQDGYSEQDILRYQQMAANDGQSETGYNTNLGQRETNSQAYNTGSQPYRTPDDSNKNDDYSRPDRSRSRKVYRIKNPFQHAEDTETPQEPPQDIDTSASNQYAAMQYSLPPEQFLAQMKAEGQYQQFSTPSPAPSYTVTPQPQYQYSTLSVSGYDNGQQSNYNSRVETRPYAYNNNANSFQYNNNANAYNQDTVASTPIPNYLSTALPNNQYIGTPANSYLSSPSSVYVSSPQNIQQYVSSPASFDYNNNRVSTIGSDSIGFQNNEVNKRMQIDHYDNSGNVIRYPNNAQSQYQNEFSSSTISPTSSYFDNKHDSWQNTGNSEINTLSKSIQDNQAQYNNLRYNTVQPGNKQDSNVDNINSDTHRIGSMPAANNLYLNIVKPDYQVMNNLKHREQETGLTYSHGDYGWKQSDKKSNYPLESSTPSNNFRYQIHSLQPETGAYSQVSFQMDAGKEYSYDQTPKPTSDKIDAEEFAKAAAKAHENYKQQLKANSYASNSQYNSNYYANNPYLNSYFLHANKQKQTYDDDSNQNSNAHSPSDLITASPFYYTSSRENIFDTKQKLPFDHDKALKNIVPIDVSNVVPHTNGLSRVNPLLDAANKINIFNIGKDHSDLIQQSSPPTNDAVYYKDKNSFYSVSYNKPKPEYSLELDRLKQSDSISSYFGKEQPLDLIYNNGGYSGNKRLLDNTQHNMNSQFSVNSQDSTVSSANIQQNLHRPTQQSDGMSGFLKINDIPHRLTESYTADSLRFNNNNFDQNVLPTPLPLRLNQNVDNHHLDVASEILNKLMGNKAATQNRPDIDSQPTNSLSAIHGYKIANPYNVDLKLVAEMLKGKTTIDDSQMLHLRDQYDKPSLPLKFDVSQLQQMNNFKNENPLALSNAISVLANSYYDIYNGGRFPYQGVKYSRSEEEAENIPIADSSNNLAIGAVLDEDDSSSVPEETNITEHQENIISLQQDADKSKTALDTDLRILNDRKNPFDSPYSKRHSHTRKYPKSEISEPYPLLKPPPPLRQSRFGDKNRRRLHKHKVLRVFKTEPLFEANSLNVEDFNSKTRQHSSVFGDQNLDIEERRT